VVVVCCVCVMGFSDGKTSFLSDIPNAMGNWGHSSSNPDVDVLTKFGRDCRKAKAYGSGFVTSTLMGTLILTVRNWAIQIAIGSETMLHLDLLE